MYLHILARQPTSDYLNSNSSQHVEIVYKREVIMTHTSGAYGMTHEGL